MNTFKKYLTYLFVAIVLSACAPSVVVQKERYFWPPPPNPPRIEWLGEYRSQLDLEMTPSRQFKEFIIGEDPPILLKKPSEVRADAQFNKIYVCDAYVGKVFIFDLAQKQLRMLSTAGPGLPENINPVGMALDRDSNLYVLEPRLMKILLFSSSEKYIRSIDLVNICKRPVALAIDKKRGRLYVSDVKLDKIFVFNLDGALLFSIGSSGDGEGAFNKPVSIASNSKGDIIVADSFNARVQIFDESGTFRRAFGKRGDGAENFQLIKSLAVDEDDNIYVVDSRSHSIKIFNLSGELLYSLGGYYSVSASGKLAPGGFLLPIGIDIDGRGRIFVADQLNARIQVFQYLSGANASIPLPNQAK